LSYELADQETADPQGSRSALEQIDYIDSGQLDFAQLRRKMVAEQEIIDAFA